MEFAQSVLEATLSMEELFQFCYLSKSLIREELLKVDDLHFLPLVDILMAWSTGICENDECVRSLAAYRQRLWEILHSFHWKDTLLVYRLLFGAVTQALIGISFIRSPGECDARSLVYAGDLGVLLGSPDTSLRLNSLISIISEARSLSQSASFVPIDLDSLVPIQCSMLCSDSSASLVPVSNQPSVLEFYEQYFAEQQPVVLTNCLDEWPAFADSSHSWQDLNYLLSVGGTRTVPVELGEHYLAPDAGSQLMTLHDFIHQHVVTPSTSDPASSPRGGYLAQHELLQQISTLQRDIHIPDYCALLLDSDTDTDAVTMENDVGDPHMVTTQAWFGPLGTISPLHFDAYHNLLAQVAGYKYVRLFAPSDSHSVYPRTDGRMTNNSQVDLRDFYGTTTTPAQPDCQYQFPKLAGARYSECILGPGEMLFIPRGYWHYVQAIDAESALEWERNRLSDGPRPRLQAALHPSVFSWSLSFWWGGRRLPQTL